MTVKAPDIAFYEPRIPPNTGNAIRLAAATGSVLHLIEPLGFNFNDRDVQRAGLDYHDLAVVRQHKNWDHFAAAQADHRIIAFSVAGAKRYTDVTYRPTDILLFGPEIADLPDHIKSHPGVAEVVRIPMLSQRRSLNLANCAALAVYEAWRQLGFAAGV